MATGNTFNRNAVPFVPAAGDKAATAALIKSFATISSKDSDEASDIFSDCLSTLSDDAGFTAHDSDGEMSSADIGDDSMSQSEHDAGVCAVYPILFMLKVQCAVARQRIQPSVVYSTRTEDELTKAGVIFDPPEVSQARSTPTTPVLPWRATSMPKAKLPTASAGSWVSQQQSAADKGEDEKLERVARSILNKLTIDKFDSLYEQLATCGLKTPAHLSMLMSQIFEKASLQHNFISMYVDLCVRLEADERLAGESGRDGFRKLVLNECQKSFQELLTPRPRSGQTGSSENSNSESTEESDGQCKKKALGNIKLVGQFMVRGLIDAKLLISCSNVLLNAKDIRSEGLEALCALLTVAGPTFDKKDFKHYESLNAIFREAADLVRDKAVPSRTRFLLRDVLELREAGWTSHSILSTQSTGPMKLDELREQQAAESRYAGPARNMEKSQKASPAALAACLGKLRNIVVGVDRGSNISQQKENKNKTEAVKTSELPNGQKQEAKKQEEAKTSMKSKVQSILQGRADQVDAKQDLKTLPSLLPKTVPTSLLKPEQTCQPRSWHNSTTKVKPTVAPTVAPAPAGMPIKKPVAPTVAPAPAVMPIKSPAPVKPSPKDSSFNLKSFHQELATMLRTLRSDSNVTAALHRVQKQHVPKKHQAAEFVDIVTRSAEETRKNARRSSFAFAAGLVADLFDKQECLLGMKVFFEEVYEELCTDIPLLPGIMIAELMPALYPVLPMEDLFQVLPEELRVS